MDPHSGNGGIGWSALWDGAVLAVLFGGLGRAARWARKERLGGRRWSIKQLLWEGPLVLFSGFVGSGFAEAMNFSQKAEVTCIALLAYFGPEFIEDLVMRFRDRELPKPPPDPPAGGAAA